MDYYETLYEHGIYYAPSPGALVHYGRKSGFADVWQKSPQADKVSGSLSLLKCIMLDVLSC